MGQRRTIENGTYIYALCEPVEEFKPRYVGRTWQIKSRFRSHQSAPSKALAPWLASLSGEPRLIVLEEIWDLHHCPAAREAERWWIQFLLSQGHDLINRDGRGVPLQRHKKRKPA